MSKGSITSILFRSDDKPFGITWEEWTTKWWKWFLSFPKANNPAFDDTGEKIGRHQPDPNVWFLAGNIGGTTERIIKIPSGKAILFPIINVTISFSENPALKTDSDIISFVKSQIDDIGEKQANIDGEELNISQDFRVKSPPFDFSYPSDNIFDARDGPTRGAGDGYWIFLKPLPPGEHTIKTLGSCLSGKILINSNLKLIIVDQISQGHC